MSNYAIRIVHRSGGSFVEWWPGATVAHALAAAWHAYAGDVAIKAVMYAGVQQAS